MKSFAAMLTGFLLGAIVYAYASGSIPNFKCYTTNGVAIEQVKKPHPKAGTFEHEVKRTI